MQADSISQRFAQPKRTAQYSAETGELIDIFPSMNVAAKVCCISVHLIGFSNKRNNRAAGFYWRVLDNDAVPLQRIVLPKRRLPLNFKSNDAQLFAFGRKAQPVAAYDSTGKLITAFESIAKGARAFHIAPSSIHDATRMPHYSTGSGSSFKVGTYWRKINSVAEAPNQIVPVEHPQLISGRNTRAAAAEKSQRARERRIVVQYDMNNEPTGLEVPHQSAAARIANVSPQMINLHILNPREYKSAGGFIWKLKYPR